MLRMIFERAAQWGLASGRGSSRFGFYSQFQQKTNRIGFVERLRLIFERAAHSGLASWAISYRLINLQFLQRPNRIVVVDVVQMMFDRAAQSGLASGR